MINKSNAPTILSMIRLFSIIVMVIFLLETGREAFQQDYSLSQSAILLFVAITGLVITWKWILPGSIVIITAGVLLCVETQTIMGPGFPFILIGILFALFYLIFREK